MHFYLEFWLFVVLKKVENLKSPPDYSVFYASAVKNYILPPRTSHSNAEPAQK
nr:MAG TPA: hypothetical protein [Caudoviricetes sp.]